MFDGSHKSLVHEYLGASRCVSKKEEVCIEQRGERKKKEFMYIYLYMKEEQHLYV